MSVAEEIPAALLLQAIRDAGVTDVVAVPDTHQRTLIELLVSGDEPRLIQTATEDEAVTLAAGLIVGGRRPILQIQHAGLYACVNHLRGVGIDGRFPLVFLIGLLGRDVEKTPRENFGSMVRYAEPLLDALEVPWHRMEGPADTGLVGRAFREAEERRGPVALLVGAATA